MRKSYGLIIEEEFEFGAEVLELVSEGRGAVPDVEEEVNDVGIAGSLSLDGFRELACGSKK